MADSYSMDDRTYKATQEALEGKADCLQAYADAAAGYVGATSAQFVEAFQARQRFDAYAHDSADLTRSVESFKVTQKLLKVLLACKRFEKKFSVTPRIDWLMTDDDTNANAILVLPRGGQRKRKPLKSGTKAKASRISAWTAYERTNDNPDCNIVIERNMDGTYTDFTNGTPGVVITRAKRGLAGHALRTYPDSAWAKLLGDYGTTL